MHAYHNVNNEFPIGSTGYSAAAPNLITTRNTWIPYVWPYVEQQNLFEQWNFTIGWNNWQSGTTWNTVPNSTASTICTPISLYYCPSDRGATEPAYNLNDPTHPRLRGNYVASLGPYSSPPSTSDIGNGVFGFQVVLNSSGSYAFDLTHPTQTRINQITNGTSNTLMMSESIMTAMDAAGGDQRGDVFNDDMLYMAWGFSSFQPPNSLVADIQPYCGGSTLLSLCTPNTTGTYISARSWHPGGVNALYADGHVDFMSNSVSQSIWQTMGTRDGGGTGSSGSSVANASLVNPNFSTPQLSQATLYSGSDTSSTADVEEQYTNGNGYIYAANPNFPTNTSWTWGGCSVLVNVNSNSAWGYDPASLPNGCTQCCSLQDTASVSQTVNLPAGNHTLSFYLAQRPNAGQNPVSVYVNGALNYTSPVPPTTWTQYTTSFNAPTAGAYNIMFSTSSPPDSDTGLTGIVLN